MMLKEGPIIINLQNRVTHYDVKNGVGNSKMFFWLFELVTRCEKTYIILFRVKN